MIRRFVGSTMVLSAVLLLAGETVYAAPISAFNVPVQAKMGKTKLVSLQLRNDSKAWRRNPCKACPRNRDRRRRDDAQLPGGQRPRHREL
jgi:hypothetical protein